MEYSEEYFAKSANRQHGKDCMCKHAVFFAGKIPLLVIFGIYCCLFMFYVVLFVRWFMMYNRIKKK